MSEEKEVDKLPQCNICECAEAKYDGKTTQGTWAYMCESCFQRHGVGLGVGSGQRLVLRKEDDKDEW